MRIALLVEEEFHSYLRLMGRAFQDLGLTRAAATILLYLEQADAAWRLSEAKTDLARCAIQLGRPAEAAKFFNEAGWLGHAAIQLEDAGDDRGARVLWERLAPEEQHARSEHAGAGSVGLYPKPERLLVVGARG